MKTWKIHLLWAVIAFVFATGLSRALIFEREAAFRKRESELRNEISDLNSRVAQSDTSRTGESRFRGGSDPSTTRSFGGEEGESSADEKEMLDRLAGEKKADKKKKKVRPPITRESILALLKSSKRDTRRKAIKQIMKLEDLNLKVELLREAVKTGGSDVKYQGILMFDQLPKPQSTQLALEFLQGGESAWVRGRAARELSQIADLSSMRALQNAFMEDDRTVKYWSAKALQALGYDDPVRQLVATASTTLNDPDGAVRERAVQRLGHLGTADAVHHLAKALSDPNSRVRREAIESLGNTNLSAAIPVIQQGLSDPKPSVRREAVGSLAKIGGDQVIPFLQAALKDPDREVVRRARRAIDRIQNPKNNRSR